MPRERPDRTPPCRLVLIDEQQVFTDAIDSIVGSLDAIELTIVFVVEKVEYIRELKPDVIVCDPSFGGVIRLDYVAELRKAIPSARIVVLTGRAERNEVQIAIESGVQSFILKSERLEAIKAALEFVCLGGVAFSLPAASIVASAAMEPRSGAAQAGPSRKGLSPREIQMIQLIAQGETDANIGKRLGISARTVQQHVSNALNKLGCRTRSEAVAHVMAAPLMLGA